jgi:hypothetical protein
MTTSNAHFMQTFYSGTSSGKLAEARKLYQTHLARPTACPSLAAELAHLREQAGALNDHMRAMGLGRLCSHCAARPDGGCCSAYMADNTDSIQILINLLLGIEVEIQESGAENCCFLGIQGCLFLAKPIFCLNYNCTGIVDSAADDSLAILYQRAAAVLSRQIKVESLLLEALRHR